MVVSSYEYDKDEHIEPYWQDIPLDPRYLAPRTGMDAFFESNGGTPLHMQALLEFATLASDATYGAALPPLLRNASVTESWFQYLSRVGEDEGLLAEALFMRVKSITPMVEDHAYVATLGEAHGRSVCEKVGRSVADRQHRTCSHSVSPHSRVKLDPGA